jgi:hypothetical protein
MELLRQIWHDSVGSKVIAALIIFLTGSIGAWVKTKWSELWAIKLTMTNHAVGYQAGAGFPLKCHVEMRNDSARSVEVSVSSYNPKNLTLKSFPPEVMQVRFNNKWFPVDPVDRVAVLPGQLCRAWIGMDDTKFNEVQVNAAAGAIGTLVVSANKKHISFEL